MRCCRTPSPSAPSRSWWSAPWRAGRRGRARRMRYMLLIYIDEQALSDTEREQCYDESTQLAHEMKSAGQYLEAAPLYPTSTATSVRVREGKRLVTDGPF